MDDTARVAICNGADNLNEDLSGFDLVETALLLDIVGELSATGQLHDHDHLLALDKRVVQLNDILVSQLLDAVGLLVERVYFVRVIHLTQQTTVQNI